MCRMGTRLDRVASPCVGWWITRNKTGVNVDTNTLLIIIVLVLLLGGGGIFYRGRRG